MNVFVPSMIGMGKVEGNNKIQEIIHKYADDLPTHANALEEYPRWERRYEAVMKEN